MADSLLSFPSEILAHIIELADCPSCLLKLWRTGNAQLQRKLSQGITNVSLRQSWLTSSDDSCLPHIIFLLPNLRSLSLYSTEMLMNNHREWLPFLKSLPKTLETLEIESRDAQHVFGNYDPDLDSCRRIDTDYPRGTSQLIDIEALFPRLHTLRVVNDEYDQLAIEPRDFGALPSTLTSLSCGSRFEPSSNSNIVFASLPRRLVSWDVTIAYRAHLLDWDACPPTLTRITCIKFKNTESSMSWLPKTLRKVHLARYGNIFPDPDSLRLLPPHLEKLSLGSFSVTESDEWSRNLPIGLETLELRSRFELPNGMRHFPPHLKVLTFASLDDWPKALLRTQDANFWTSSITVLRLLGTAPTPAIVLDVLPPSLTQFQLGMRSGRPPADWVMVYIKSLPPNLKTLEIRLYCPGSFRTEGKFPESLSRIHTIMEESLAGWSIEEFTQVCSSLPDSLSDLAAQIDLPSDLIQLPFSLPPNLTHLHTGVWQPNWFASIPRTVTNLRIDMLRIFEAESNEDMFATLPSGLKMFCFDMTLESVPQKICCGFATLQELVTLKASPQLVFKPAVLKTLSRKLNSLSIGVESFGFEEAMALPPKLDSLLLSGGVDFKLPGLETIWPVSLAHRVPRSYTAFLSALKKRLIEECNA